MLWEYSNTLIEKLSQSFYASVLAYVFGVISMQCSFFLLAAVQNSKARVLAILQLYRLFFLFLCSIYLGINTVIVEMGNMIHTFVSYVYNLFIHFQCHSVVITCVTLKIYILK